MENELLAVGLVGVVVGLVLGLFLSTLFKPKNDRLVQSLAEMKGALEGQSAGINQRVEHLQSHLDSRIGAVSERTTTHFTTLSHQTESALSQVGERISTLSNAEQTISSLAGEVRGLQTLLSNKQTRGAFGETQLDMILSNTLTPQDFQLQYTLSTGKRVDALLQLNPENVIGVDAKFPLESYQNLISATTTEARKRALTQFGRDMKTHIKDVSEKYIISGETADSVFLFLPAESIYAELHAQLPEIVEEAHSKRVWIVSPTTLMAALITLRGMAKDGAILREAQNIRKELGMLHKDVVRLQDRAEAASKALASASQSMDGVLTSARKAGSRADKLQNLDF